MRLVTVVALLAAGLLGVLLVREKSRSTGLEKEIGQFGARVKASQEALAKLEAEHNELRQQQGLPPVSSAAVPQPAAPAPPKESAASLETARLLEERTNELAEARKAREAVDAQVKQLEARVQSLTEEMEKLSAAEKSVREQLEASGKRVASLEGELKTRDERLQRAELSIRDLRQQGDDRGRRAAQLAKISDDFDDLNRRRDTYVTNLMRRYREVTDLYRTLSLRQETPGPRDDLSRIQNAISLAEDDLKQLQALNAQARRLQKDLETIRK